LQTRSGRHTIVMERLFHNAHPRGHFRSGAFRSGRMTRECDES